ncbi:MAG: CotH kinase family protein [Clostridia bacterium]|nr:CotH kinase family protein [Clostridia bacterium]
MKVKVPKIITVLSVCLLCVLFSFVFFACKDKNDTENGVEEITHVVSFDTDGGNAVASQTVKDGENAVQPIDPEKIGYSFLGWYKEGLETEFVFQSERITVDTTVYAKWNKKEFLINVLDNSAYGVTLSGGALEQCITIDNEFEPILIEENLGYKFLYYSVSGKNYYDNVIDIDFNTVSEDETVNIVCEYATDELPIVNINTENVEINSKINYVDMIFSIENCESELSDIIGGIRLRGNTTSTYPKKPYRIKFDKKQSLFGLEKSKSWVLLADYLDPSCMHNYTAFSLGKELDGLSFTPTPHHVNLYLNGEYEGLYVLCEQIQENSGRIGIEKSIKADMTNLSDYNFYICMDESVINDTDAVLDETYFYLEDYNKYIELKYPEKSDFKSEEQFNAFFNDLKVYVKSVFDNVVQNDYQFISENLDTASLIDYLIIDELMMERDHSYKSFNMYYIGEDNKLYFGPIWDYDWCLFTPWTSQPNSSYDLSDVEYYSNAFFQCVHDTPELYSALKNRYNTISSDILDDFINEIMLYEYSIEQSSILNAQKWYSEMDSDVREKNVVFLTRFLIYRKTF